jgi:CxxC motif-containing protein (DUF1111 family)
VSGRVSKLKDGRIGRFGWKAQKATLGDFVLTACAIELGLNVPGEPQAGLPPDPSYRAPGLDLVREECDALTAYIARLPAPVERRPSSPAEEKLIASGRALFTESGCAACHAAKLGEVAGIYSDLLLHNMGPELADTGSYGSFTPDATDEEELTEPLPSFTGSVAGRAGPREATSEAKLIGATRHEWRTPPLWGLRDTAPYLHDGRAATLEQAIAFHGGEGSRSRAKYFALAPAERFQLQAFLKSLVAPE